jgi:hypothetical protein
MSSTKNGNYSDLFLIYLVIFCVMNWGVWWHYQTMQGPTALATVVDKHQIRGKNSYSYYLTVQFAGTKQQKATSNLSVTKSHYQDFAVNDRFLIKYAEADPTEAAFVGESFFKTWAVVGYLFVGFVLVTSFRAKVRQGRSTSALPATASVYSTKRTLTWTVIGILTFSSGIVSCRHASNIDSTLPAANEYAQARLLSVQYLPDTATTALVRLPVATTESTDNQIVGIPLTAEQYALLRAKLLRPQVPALDVLVKYPAAAPKQATLADEQAPASASVSSPFPNYNTLGVVLCVIGIIIFVVNLGKYVQHSNTYE